MHDKASFCIEFDDAGSHAADTSSGSMAPSVSRKAR